MQCSEHHESTAEVPRRLPVYGELLNYSSAVVFYEMYLLFQITGNFKGGSLKGGFQAMEYKSRYYIT